ncbi:MAG: M23 family metallopeptidase [Candidatus Promineifilaceae bacterium]
MLKFLRSKWVIRSVITLLVLVGGLILYITFGSRGFRSRVGRIGTFMDNPTAYGDWQLIGGERCGDAPMLMPSDGFIGVGWNDGLPPLYQHTGYDIFGPDGEDNITPIYAVYDGYLTRESNWRSAVIIRHPDFDALPDIVGDEVIWTYYTHMASRDGETSFISEQFPRGTRDLFVEAGTLLGYQGSWSGTIERNMTRHLHLSIVKSDTNDSYLNETQIANTLDPAPFLGLDWTDEQILKCLEGG